MPYLLIKNDDANNDWANIWVNFAPVDEIFIEIVASYWNINALPESNSSPGNWAIASVNLTGANYPFTAWASVGYEDDPPPRGFNFGTKNGPGSYILGGVIEAEIETTVQMRLTFTGIVVGGAGDGKAGWELEFRVDGVTIDTVTGWGDDATPTVQALQLSSQGADEDTEWRVRSVSLGTTWGASDIFSADYASGDVTTVPGPWSGAVGGETDAVLEIREDNPDPDPHPGGEPMSPPVVGYEVDIIDEPVPVAAPTATDTVFVAHSAAVGEATLQEVNSKQDARDAFPATAAIHALADAYFEEGGARMYVSKLGVADLPVTLARFTADLGPGQLVAPEVVTGPNMVVAAQWAWDTNRIALLDGPDGSTVAALVILANAVIAGEGRFAALEADTLIIPGTASGQTREVPASIVKAALIARSDIATGNPNLAAAGVGNNAAGRTRYVLGIKAERNDADRQALATAQVNTFKNVFGKYIAAYDYVSLADIDEFPQWWDLSGSRTIMAIRALEGAVAEMHMFGQIDGEGQFLTRYEGALRGELAALARLGALYNSETSPGYRVDVSPVVNPLANLAIGKVTSQIVARTSPFARSLQINVVRRAITREVV